LDSIQEKEDLFRKLLVHPKIKKIDGKGLMLALVFEDAQFCRKVIDACVDSGLLIDWFLYAENRIRLSPPLIISKEQIEIVSGIIIENIQKQCNL
jgi:acetylornithine/succinyldiaminopimelate/putrescine aminotransferase